MHSQPAPSRSFRHHLDTFGTSLFTALFIYFLEIIFVIWFAALIYSGDLLAQMPRALALILLGDAIMCAITALISSNPGAIGVQQDTPGAMISVVAAGVIAALAGAPEMQFATVVVMIMFTTMTTGLLLLVLGVFKLGTLVRFLPYPVVGGFLAGTGWLLVDGGLTMMLDAPFGPAWLQPDTLALWGTAAVTGVLVFGAARKLESSAVIPVALALAIALFYGYVWAAQVPIEDLRAAGWLLDSQANGAWQSPLSGDILSQVDWGTVRNQIPALLPVAIICVIELLLISSSLELVNKKDADLNRELVVAGIGNVAAGFMGGLTGYTDISYSTLNKTLSDNRRLVGVMIALMLGATMFVGISLILFIPRFVFGAVLIYLGLVLLAEWLYEAWLHSSRLDLLVIIAILAIIVTSGFLQGVLAGLILAVILFVVSYSRISVIKFALSGREYRSRVTRGSHEQAALEAHGDELYILKLEGFIFFGTANGLLAKIRAYRQNASAPVKHVVMDFSRVSGVDSTGMLSFARMMQWSVERGVELAFTGLSDSLAPAFERQRALNPEAVVRYFPDLDHGIEWCENELIAAHAPQQLRADSLIATLEEYMRLDAVRKLLPYLKRREFAPGEYLIKVGDAPDFMYFIESGQVTAQLEPANGKPVRLETMQGGRIGLLPGRAPNRKCCGRSAVGGLCVVSRRFAHHGEQRLGGGQHSAPHDPAPAERARGASDAHGWRAGTRLSARRIGAVLAAHLNEFALHLAQPRVIAVTDRGVDGAIDHDHHDEIDQQRHGCVLPSNCTSPTARRT